MAITYQESTRTFFLDGKGVTYAFCVNDYDYLEHLYFGKIIGLLNHSYETANILSFAVYSSCVKTVAECSTFIRLFIKNRNKTKRSEEITESQLINLHSQKYKYFFTILRKSVKIISILSRLLLENFKEEYPNEKAYRIGTGTGYAGICDRRLR